MNECSCETQNNLRRRNILFHEDFLKPADATLYLEIGSNDIVVIKLGFVRNPQIPSSGSSTQIKGTNPSPQKQNILQIFIHLRLFVVAYYVNKGLSVDSSLFKLFTATGLEKLPNLGPSKQF